MLQGIVPVPPAVKLSDLVSRESLPDWASSQQQAALMPYPSLPCIDRRLFVKHQAAAAVFLMIKLENFSLKSFIRNKSHNKIRKDPQV